MSTLHQHTVAITGGARGIGRATALAFLAAGARVAIGDIDAELVAATAAELGCVGLPLDVADAESFAAFLDDAEEHLGPLTVLVNNAGIMPTGAFLDEPLGVAERQLGINVTGVVIGSKLAGTRFATRGRGHLVNVASVAGVMASPGLATYCASKHAVVGLGEALRQELPARGVRVTTVLPGFVRTELIAGISPGRIVERIGVVDPEDIADAIVDAVATGHTGARYVPRAGAATSRLMGLLPVRLRDGVARRLGGHEVMLDTDQAARAAYRLRTESETTAR